MDIRICVPSYKRPKVETLNYISKAKVYVDNKEYKDYITANKGFESNIISVPDGVQGNVSRIRNYILDTEFKNGADVVVLLDDDMKRCYRWEIEGIKKFKREIEETEFYIILEKYSQMCDELGFKEWGMNVNMDNLTYHEDTPFSFTAFLGGPFQAFLKGCELRYDETLPLKEDYDMTLQQCNKYRGVLRCNFLCYEVKQSTNKGGCAAMRSRKKEAEQLDLLRKKWGSRIVKVDTSNKGKSKKEKLRDYNPIIKIPIKGV